MVGCSWRTRLRRHSVPTDPKLAELLAAAAVEAGAKVRLGATVASFTQDDDGVDVVFSRRRHRPLRPAGRRGRGPLAPRVARLGIEAEVKPVGMGIWRVHARRPAEVDHSELVYDGPCYIAGFTPTGPGHPLRLSRRARAEPVLRPRPNSKIADNARTGRRPITARGTRSARTSPTATASTTPGSSTCSSTARGTAAGPSSSATPRTPAHPPWRWARRWPWRTPSVLAELLLTRDRLDQDLFDAFLARRLPRAGAVVDGSMQLATWLLERDRNADVPGLMGRIYGLLSEPA